MYKVVPWSIDLDLTSFYKKAEERGFYNNSNQKMLVDSLSKEKEWNVWILYYNDDAIGSVGAHSFSEMGNNAYRIAVRSCVFTDMIPGTYGQGLRTISVIRDHQNPTAQFLIPTCLDWVPKDSKIFITSNENSIGTQSRVHRTFAPEMVKQNIMKHVCDMIYRGTKQSIWEFFPEKFYFELNKRPRWS